MSFQDRIAKIQARKIILDALNMVYPSAMKAASLNRVVLSVDPTYSLDLLRKDLFYLFDKQYILWVDDAIGGSESFEYKYAKLTARGKDVADQMSRDEALEI